MCIFQSKNTKMIKKVSLQLVSGKFDIGRPLNMANVVNFTQFLFLTSEEIVDCVLDVCILSDRMSKIRFDSHYFSDRIFSIRSAAQSIVEYSTFETPFFGCRIFDIRSALLRMSDFRHSIGRPSNVEYSTFEAPFVGFSLFRDLEENTFF